MSKAQRKAFIEGLNWADTHPINTDEGTEALRRYPDSPAPKNVREIVGEYLKAEGYNGLYFEHAGCFCMGYNLAPGECLHRSCRPGVLVDGKIVAKDGE